MIDRVRPPSSKPTWCSTRPSRASKPMRRDQRSHVSRLPSTWKLGPSGWVMASGRRLVRSGPHSPSPKLGWRGGRGADPWSKKRTTRALDQVDVDDDALDRPQPGDVGRLLLEHRDRPEHTSAELVLELELARREREDDALACGR